MQRLIVNGTERRLENVPEYWGNLLEWVEQDAAARAEVVTEVRFDDVEQPAFRHAALGQCPLSELDSIEVETASKRALIDDALAHGVMSAHALAAAAKETTGMFRNGNVAAANQRLAEFGDGIRSLLVLVSAVSAACGATLDQLDVSGRTMSAEVNALVQQLETLVEAQQAQDWLTVADILEYEFEPALGTWRSMFEGLRVRTAAGA